VPDAANARADHEVGGFLRCRGGDSEHPQPNTTAPNECREMANGLHFPPLIPFVYLRSDPTKGNRNPQAEILKPLVAQERSSQIADTHQNSFGLVIPAEEPFDGDDQIRYAEAAS